MNAQVIASGREPTYCDGFRAVRFSFGKQIPPANDLFVRQDELGHRLKGGQHRRTDGIAGACVWRVTLLPWRFRSILRPKSHCCSRRDAAGFCWFATPGEGRIFLTEWKPFSSLCSYLGDGHGTNVTDLVAGHIQAQQSRVRGANRSQALGDPAASRRRNAAEPQLQFREAAGKESIE